MDEAKYEFTKQLCLKSLFFFFETIIAPATVPAEERLPLKLNIHKPVCEFAQDDTIFRKGFKLPRYFLKSSLLTKCKPIFDWIRNPEERILIANEVFRKASEFLGFIRKNFEHNERLHYYFPKSKVDRNWIAKHQWSNDGMELPCEGIYDAPSISAIGVGGARQGLHVTRAYLDDLIGKKAMSSEVERRNTETWFNNVPELLVNPYKNWIYLIGCLTKDTDVLMEDGTWKKINQVKPGEYVVSLRKDDKKWQKSLVHKMIPQGKDDVYTLTTRHGKVTGNARHPFLKIVPTKYWESKKCGIYKIQKYELEWTPLQDLKQGDFIISVDYYDDSTPMWWGGDRLLTDDIMWLYGFMLGDGWVTKHNRSYQVCFAPGVDEKLNEKALRIFRESFGLTLKKNMVGSYFAYSKKVGQLFIDSGFKKGAKNKEVPEWVFQCSLSQRQAFIKGLIDADGTLCKTGTESYRIELSNKKLIQQLKLLTYTCGLPSGKIFYRQRWLQPPHSKKPVWSKTWSLGINFQYDAKYQVGKIDDFDLKDYCRIEKIQTIQYTGKQPVYDLAVENPHSFIANGFVVHNTNWAPGDLYETVKHRNLGYQWLTIKAEDAYGNATWPEKLPKSEIEAMKSDPERFVIYYTQFQNNPIDSGITDFKNDWIKDARYRLVKVLDKANDKEYMALEYQLGEETKEVFLHDLRIDGVIDPAGFKESKMKSNARNAIVIVGTDEVTNLHFILEAWAQYLSEPDQLYRKVAEFHEKYSIRRWAIETFATQGTVYKILRSKARENGIYLPITELEKDVGKNAKEIRIRSLQDDFSTQTIYLRNDMGDFITEYLAFPTGSTNDLLDALAYHKQWWTKVDRKALDRQGDIDFERYMRGRNRVTGG